MSSPSQPKDIHRQTHPPTTQWHRQQLWQTTVTTQHNSCIHSSWMCAWQYYYQVLYPAKKSSFCLPSRKWKHTHVSSFQRHFYSSTADTIWRQHNKKFLNELRGISTIWHYNRICCRQIGSKGSHFEKATSPRRPTAVWPSSRCVICSYVVFSGKPRWSKMSTKLKIRFGTANAKKRCGIWVLLSSPSPPKRS